jgi:hypothetical protein
VSTLNHIRNFLRIEAWLATSGHAAAGRFRRVAKGKLSML